MPDINEIIEDGKIKFQTIAWDNFHEESGDVDDDGDPAPADFVIQAYGRTKDNKSIYARINGFTPYFFVKIPDEWGIRKAKILVDTIQKHVHPELRTSLIKYNVVKKNDLWEFSNYKQFNFLRLVFNNHTGFKAYASALNRKLSNYLLGNRPRFYKLYESNIEPMLRFMHIQDIKASGWVEVDKESCEIYPKEDAPTHCDYNISLRWKSIRGIENDNMQKFKIASFDLECTSGDGSFPQANRDSDKIIQIGTTISYAGESECYYKHIVTLGSCDDIEGVDVEPCKTEVELLMKWAKMIRKQDPDILTGYNIFGFDYKYLYDRAKHLHVEKKFARFGRQKRGGTNFDKKELSSSALGDNLLSYYEMAGRLSIDVMKVVQRDFKLGSYKLDNVASSFIKDKIKDIRRVKRKDGSKYTKIITKSAVGLVPDNFVTITYNDTLSDNKFDDGKKYRVLDVKNMVVEGQKVTEIHIDERLKIDLEEDAERGWIYSWCMAKDDVTPQDIFRLQKGSSADRATVARYCIQDCALCNRLIDKLQIVTNNISMSNVCSVPLSYIFMRGQGVKLFSLVAKRCRQLNHVIPTIKKPYLKPGEEEKKDSYEGAIVLDPVPGLYDVPIPVLDYASLYPRSMIFKNISHETIVTRPEYDNLPDYVYRDVKYQMNGAETTRRYAQNKDGSLGIIPTILNDLLNSRSATKKLMKSEQDPFKKKIYDGLQLAFKLTANSLYGQLGASTSPICYKDLAASTTATGRDMIIFAKGLTEGFLPLVLKPLLSHDYEEYENIMNMAFDGKMLDLPINNELRNLLVSMHDMVFKVKDDRFKNPKKNINNRADFIKVFREEVIDLVDGLDVVPSVIYGDTDSIFCRFDLSSKGKREVPKNEDFVHVAIQLGILTGVLTNMLMPYPHDLEYEKTFWPFSILTKKRYVGNKYEYNNKDYEQVNMGVVLKRRDNATIVKIVCGGIVHKMLKERSPQAAVKFTQSVLSDVLKEKYDMDKFVITKTLRGNYADRNKIVHAVLADRIGRRDPGNKPQSNDRVPYIYVVTKEKPKLQGDRVETPEFIKENNLKIDYLFYITNQIMKPACQFLALVVKEPEKIFDDFIQRELNKRKGAIPLTTTNYDYGVDTSVYKNKFTSDYLEDDESEDFVVLKKKPKKKVPVEKKEDDCVDFSFNVTSDSIEPTPKKKPKAKVKKTPLARKKFEKDKFTDIYD